MRFIPQTIVGRTVLVLLVGLTVSHLISMAIYSGDRQTALTTAGGRHIAERVAAAIQLVEGLEPPTRPQAIQALWGPVFSVTWTLESALGADAGDWRAGLVRSALSFYLDNVSPERVRVAYLKPIAEKRSPEKRSSDALGNPWVAMESHMRRMKMESPQTQVPQQMSRLAAVWHGSEILQVSVRLSDASWLNFATPAQRWQPFWWSQVFLSIVLMTVAVLVLSVWAVRRATGPLGVFTRAAERLGMDMEAPALDEEGPREVRNAARAFNEMQQRLRTFVRDRTQMLAAISHDLRTPITRLRLRAEFIEDPEQQKKMLADLEQMETMISATLAFAQDDAGEEPRKPFDIGVMLQSLCDDAADAGHKAAYDGEPRFTYTGRPVALKRALSNLIDNAVNYGGVARIALRATTDQVTVSIDDDGPGIPDDQLERVFQPFYRIENSRSRETGGVGLGLAVVRSIVRGHGGDVTLANRDEDGFTVTVTLPLG